MAFIQESHEQKISTTLYQITAIYKNEIDFAKSMQELIVKKILEEETAD